MQWVGCPLLLSHEYLHSPPGKNARRQKCMTAAPTATGSPHFTGEEVKVSVHVRVGEGLGTESGKGYGH